MTGSTFKQVISCYLPCLISDLRFVHCLAYPFTVQRVCIARIMPWQDVCLSVRPSVRPSHVGIVSKRLHTLKVFSPSGSPTILVFPHQTRWQYSDGDPFNGGDEYKGVWKNHDFRPISRFISEVMQDRAILTMEGEQETAPKLSNGTILNDLEWPLTHISRSQYYSTSNNSKTVPVRAIFTMAEQ